MPKEQDDKLLDAASRGDVACMEQALDSGANVLAQKNEQEIDNGNMAIHIASRMGHVEVVKFLTETKKVSVDIPGCKGRTALMYASNVAIVQFLLENGASLDAKDKYGDTVIHVASQLGHIEVVKFLIETKKVAVDAQGGYGQIALMYSKNEEIAKLLIENGADLYAKDTRKGMLIHLAAEKGWVEILRLLVETKHFPVDAKGNEEETALMRASSIEAAELLFRNGASLYARDIGGNMGIHLAAHNNHIEVVKFFISKGVPINAKGRSGKTALMISHSHEDMARFLLENGSSPYEMDEFGNMAIHLASKNGWIEVMRVLLQVLKFPVDTLNAKGLSAIMIAAEVGHVQIAELLFANCASLTAQNVEGDTAIHIATRSRHCDFVKFLLDQGVFVDIPGNNLCSALMVAVEIGDVETAELFIRKGASLMARNAQGDMAIHIAVRNGHADLVNLLLDTKQCPIDVCGALDRTPLMNAGSKKIAEILLTRGAVIDSRHTALFLLAQGVDLGTGNAVVHTAAKGQIDLLKFLLDRNVPVDVKGAKDKTPLMNSANKEIGEFLLKRGATIDSKDTAIFLFELGVNLNVKRVDGNCAIHIASRNAQLEILDYLLDKNIPIDTRDENGLTALMYAPDEITAEFLINHGANIHEKADNANFAIHFAAQNGYLSVVKLLLLKGLFVDMPGCNQSTPLMYASNEGLARFLLESGASPEAIDENGGMALHWASKLGHSEVVKFWIETKDMPVDILGHKGRTALMHAPNLAVVQCLLENGASLEVRDEEGNMAIHIASSLGHIEVVKFLIETKKVPIDIPGHKGRSALMYASNVAIAQFLLEHGASSKMKDESGDSAIHVASQFGHIEVVKFLVETKKIPADVQGNQGQTALIQAAVRGHTSVVALLMQFTGIKALLSQSSEISQAAAQIAMTYVDGSGRTPLHYAVWSRNKENVRWLLTHQINVNAEDIDGKTALAYIFQSPLECSFAQRAVSGTKLSYFMTSPLFNKKKSGSQYFDEDISKILLEHGANVNIVISDDQTLLHLAVIAGHSDAVELFLKHRADVNKRDRYGKTPLHYVKQSSIAYTLLNHGADLSASDVLGNIPEDYAKNEHFESAVIKHPKTFILSSDFCSCYEVLFAQRALAFVDKLVQLYKTEKEINLDEEDPRTGRTALSYSAQLGDHDTIEWLVKHGADPNKKDRLGKTSLHYAVHGSMLEHVRALLNHPLEIDAEDNNGKTSLWNAYDECSYGFRGTHVAIMGLLATHHANVNIRNSRGKTPLHSAVEAGRSDMVELFLAHGANVDVEDKDGKTSLWHACYTNFGKVGFAQSWELTQAQYTRKSKPLEKEFNKEHIKIIELLLHHGANINIVNNDEPASVSKKSPKSEVARREAEMAAILEAMRSVTSGFTLEDPPKTLIGRQTPLHLAIQVGCSDIARLFLEHGANANAEDNDGKTPLWYAFYVDFGTGFFSPEHIKSIELLLRYKANANIRGSRKYTPLHVAVYRMNPCVVRLLLEHGVETNSEDTNGLTPIRSISKSIDRETVTSKSVIQEIQNIIELLLHSGVNINKPDQYGKTLLYDFLAQLHFSRISSRLRISQEDQLNILKFLIAKNAQVAIEDHNGVSPLHIAIEYDLFQVIELFIENGAPIHCRDHKGISLLHTAVKYNKVHIVKFLLEKGGGCKRKE